MDAPSLLRAARGEAKLSQRQLAARTGIPQPTIARIESGTQAPRFDTVTKLLAACGHELQSVPAAGDAFDPARFLVLLRSLSARKRQESADTY